MYIIIIEFIKSWIGRKINFIINYFISSSCRINRILESPRGNALLVGVGGSGKQSLTRLAASVSGLEVFQIQLRKGYSVTDLKTDLAQLYIKAGVKNIGTVFLLTDAQVRESVCVLYTCNCKHVMNTILVKR